MTEEFKSEAARVYNNKNARVVTSPSGNKVALCNFGEVRAPNIYFDPIASSTFQIDHLTLVCTDAT